jgi:hypothetical protein
MDYRKVYGGTPVGNESRCVTCANSMVVRGYGQSEHVTWCDALFRPLRVPFPVLECNRYANANLPDVETMEKYAWDLNREKTARAGIRAEEVDLQRAIGIAAAVTEKSEES